MVSLHDAHLTPQYIPAIEEILERSYVVALPMSVQFRGVTTREALLIEGPCGWGEFSPFLEYGAKEASAWLRSGIEVAWQGLPDPLRESVEVNATIPAVPPEQVPEVVQKFPGCRTFKVKVAEKGHTLAMDVARVQAVREAARQMLNGEAAPDTALEPIIRVDANRGWTVAEAIAAAHELGELDYMEQPVATVEKLREVRDEVGELCRVAADESIRRADDPYRVAQLHAADVGVMKVAPLGGPRRLLRLARELNLDVTVASALDTAVGLGIGVTTAAALPATSTQPVPAAAGLATGNLFDADVTVPLQVVEGRIAVPGFEQWQRTGDRSALGVCPDMDRISDLAAATPRRDWWFDRVREAYTYLSEAP